ncbi:transcriptional regulator, ArsR family [Tistlia consotensis]|uniref:Transcriptional regulator, ArsR family n=1 Tax=Tistlia consotensis USBA 355 TaxID=560819 RepID=A0A1Y6B9R7_9PROT|nr:metalloregulator ArsR/SmtB family transcription factor [Tistlia consotensis]SME89042.1 transcriptional regulator, ArsR family [Tistlia consotensis USBA 355]SNR25607.1 transcriptional regulator, ArsR family [Tistlia consotensis]
MIDPIQMMASAEQAARFLKTLANPNRLLILCILSQGERSVGELEELLKIRQPTLSQQLAILRDEELVETRRDGKQIFYSLASDETEQIIGLLYELYCEKSAEPRGLREARTAVG